MELEVARNGFSKARNRRANWDAIWRDCFAYGQPGRVDHQDPSRISGGAVNGNLFDATAVDGVQQLAASLLAELTPPWSRWFGFIPGPDVEDEDRDDLSRMLDQYATRIQGHLDRSNFAVEVHQCFLDLATIGTTTLLFEEAPIGDASAFHFTAVPASEMYLDGDNNGTIRRQFRKTSTSIEALRERFPHACAWDGAEIDDYSDNGSSIELIEHVAFSSGQTDYLAFASGIPGMAGSVQLNSGRFDGSPFITFRWLKGTGEIYGQSPVMSALPDIKTANKVVELILKNASLAVTGIWLAEDDGVLNPANIRLVPGSIIPKAAGSSGLTPLQTPGRLDVSELVLQDLRANIRHTLLTDRLAPPTNSRMTATEVLERSAETARLLGAIYGRLQAELLSPLLRRAVAILARRGEIPPLLIDGSTIELQYRSPLARVQAREELRNVMVFLDAAGKLNSLGDSIIDTPKAVRWLAEEMGVPRTFLTPQVPDTLKSGVAGTEA